MTALRGHVSKLSIEDGAAVEVELDDADAIRSVPLAAEVVVLFAAKVVVLFEDNGEPDSLACPMCGSRHYLAAGALIPHPTGSGDGRCSGTGMTVEQVRAGWDAWNDPDVVAGWAVDDDEHLAEPTSAAELERGAELPTPRPLTLDTWPGIEVTVDPSMDPGTFRVGGRTFRVDAGGGLEELTCTCHTSTAHYDGPDRDCPTHGEVAP